MPHTLTIKKTIIGVAILTPILAYYYAPVSRRTVDNTLVQAVRQKQTRQAQRLLRAGANPNARDTDDVHGEDWLEPPIWKGGGRTILMVASSLGDLPTVDLLLSNGAHINETDPTGKTALHHASVPGNSRLTALLRERGADLRARDNDGRTAMWYASTANDPMLVQSLFDAHLNGEEALLAAATGHPASLRYLLSHNVSVNARDASGQTALMIAAGIPNPDIVRILLRAGASVNATSHDGDTAMSIVEAAQRTFQSAPSDTRYAEVLHLLRPRQATK